MMLIPRVEKENARRGVLVQGVLWSNNALYGIPIAISLYGEGNIALIALVTAVSVALFNVCSVLALERYNNKTNSDAALKWGKILRGIITNPLSISLAFGFAANLMHLQLPYFLEHTARGLADCATPVSFIILGASFSFASASHNRKTLMVVVASRLILMPLFWLALAVLLGFRDQQIAAFLLLFGPPTAVSSYPMACAMGGDERLASEIIVFTSAIFIFSIFDWIFILRNLTLL